MGVGGGGVLFLKQYGWFCGTYTHTTLLSKLESMHGKCSFKLLLQEKGNGIMGGGGGGGEGLTLAGDQQQPWFWQSCCEIPK